MERRFPDNEHRLESYYQVYLMALKTGNTALATEYKNKLMNAFPESDYAVAVADPNYEYNIRMMDVVQDSIYQATYDRYLESDTAYVRKSFRYVSEKYPLATLMPKFMFLDALSYVQAGDAEGFKNALKALVEKYPNADVTELAGEMFERCSSGTCLGAGRCERYELELTIRFWTRMVCYLPRILPVYLIRNGIRLIRCFWYILRVA